MLSSVPSMLAGHSSKLLVSPCDATRGVMGGLIRPAEPSSPCVQPAVLPWLGYAAY